MKTIYSLSDTSVIASSEDTKKNKKYVLKLRDLPQDEKPREKMLAYGAGVLSVTELIALILNSGNKKEDVMSMAGRIVEEYGERSLVGKLDPKIMSEELGLPLIKCMQVVACAELGKRFFRKGGIFETTIHTANDVYEYTQDMRKLSKEHLRGLYLNTHHKVIHDEVISIGTLNANIIHPREVFRPALEYASAAVVLVHNHPSGHLEPSKDDREVTRQLVEAGKIMGIEVLDHVIVTENGFISIIN